jgi:hypothetical protein
MNVEQIKDFQKWATGRKKVAITVSILTDYAIDNSVKYEELNLLYLCLAEKHFLFNEEEEKAFSVNPNKTLLAFQIFYSAFNKSSGDVAWWCYRGMLRQIVNGEPVYLVDKF